MAKPGRKKSRMTAANEQLILQMQDWMLVQTEYSWSQLIAAVGLSSATLDRMLKWDPDSPDRHRFREPVFSRCRDFLEREGRRKQGEPLPAPGEAAENAELRAENAELRAKLERLRRTVGVLLGATTA